MRSPIESECSCTPRFLALLPPRSMVGQLTLDFLIQTLFLLKTNHLQHIPARMEVSAIAYTNQAVTKNAKSVCHVYVTVRTHADTTTFSTATRHKLGRWESRKCAEVRAGMATDLL